MKLALSVEENLAFWARFMGQPVTSGTIEERLSTFNLEHLASYSAGLLSAGQKRRLALSRLELVARPIWLLDEPTEGLDTTNERELIHTVRSLAAGRTLLLITHRPVGLAELDRVVVLENGKVAEAGVYANLMAAQGRLASMLDAIW